MFFDSIFLSFHLPPPRFLLFSSQLGTNEYQMGEFGTYPPLHLFPPSCAVTRLWQPLHSHPLFFSSSQKSAYPLSAMWGHKAAPISLPLPLDDSHSETVCLFCVCVCDLDPFSVHVETALAPRGPSVDAVNQRFISFTGTTSQHRYQEQLCHTALIFNWDTLFISAELRRGTFTGNVVGRELKMKRSRVTLGFYVIVYFHTESLETLSNQGLYFCHQSFFYGSCSS